MQGIKILSLFDGMSCGNIAFKTLGIDIDKYIAYEVDKYAIKVTQHNFPDTIQMGDVFKADFKQYEGFDWLIGGFPCTKFSIAQSKNRETTPYSGEGWELFMQYKRALDEVKPKYFIAENNKSMSSQIRKEITKLLGVEPVLINSALVSAQNRQRLYWVGQRNDDGTYSNVDVPQPEDRGILLKDVLDNAVAWQDKAYAYTTRCNGAILDDTLEKHRHTMVAETVCTLDNLKSHTIKTQYYRNGIANFITNGKFNASAVAEPVCAAQRGRSIESGTIDQHYEAREGGKTNALTKVQKSNVVVEPIRIGTYPNEAKNQSHDSKQYRIYDVDGKSTTLCGQGSGMGAKTGLYAVPCATHQNDKANCFRASYGEHCGTRNLEENVKNNGRGYDGVIERSDGKTYQVYEVRNGLITIKDKQYPIKLSDGLYIIRKLSVSECKRLQTIPDYYDFSVISNSQAYKCIGNGWTCDVISHLIKSCLES